MPTNVAKSKACPCCQRSFAPTSNRQKFCGGKCAVRATSVVDASGCWRWTGPRDKKTRYGVSTLRGKPTTAHRLSFDAFHGEITPGHEVCHRCDNRICVNPDHLFVGTHFDNMQDCARKRRNSRKLTDEQVLAIRSAIGVTKAELARRYGVTDVMIGKIINGDWWKYLLPNSQQNVASPE